MQSFRFRLAARLAGTMALGLALVSLLTWQILRETLDGQVDASILNVASIQAASLTDAPSGEMRFHEWELTPAEATQVRDLNRYAQVWSEAGESLLRTRYITHDLPLDRDALAAALAGELVWTKAEFEGMPVRSLYYPLGRLGHLHEPHVLQVAAPLLARNQMLRFAVLVLLAIALLITLAAFAGSWWLAGRTVRPVHEIIDQAEAIEPGRLQQRISAYADSREYQRLVQVLNIMLDRIAAAFEVQRRFTADASHELRSPLTALRGEIELALRRPRSNEEYEAVLRSAQEEVERLSRMTEDLLTLARSDAGVLSPHPEPVALGRLARELAPRLEALGGERGIRVQVDGADDVVVQGDSDLLHRLLWNLASNAVRFSPPGETVRVHVWQEPGEAVLEVSDRGPGIPPEVRDRVFERFYQVSDARSHEQGSGTGLGLAIARAIAELHGGSISVEPADGGGGARFRVRFPAPSADAQWA